MKTLLFLLLLAGAATYSNAQCTEMYDGFESASLDTGWVSSGGTQVTTLANTTPAVGAQNMSNANAGSGNFFGGVYRTYNTSQPAYLSFRVRTDNISANNGYFVWGDANTTTNFGVLFCYINSSGNLRFYNSTGVNFPINVNQWYHIEAMNIDWTNKTMDIYMDGVLILPGWEFRSNTSVDSDRVYLFNLDSANAQYDEIIIGTQPIVNNITNTICSNDSLVVNGTAYNAALPSGTEIIVGGAVNGCDSTINVALNVLPVSSSSVTDTICNGDSVLVNGTTYNATNSTGIEVFIGAGSNGCDSTVTINLNVLPDINNTITSEYCAGSEDSIVVNGTVYNEANPTGVETFTAINGCDSTVTIALNFNTVNTAITTSGITLTSDANGAAYQWVDCAANQPIAGETGQSFTASVNGDYAVVVTENNCSDTSACESITTVGVEDLDLLDFSINPNPNNGQFAVSMGDIHNVTKLEVCDVLGRLIYVTTDIEAEMNVDISNEMTGVYLVRIYEVTTNYTKRMIKE
jgi:hypothetical protein